MKLPQQISPVSRHMRAMVIASQRGGVKPVAATTITFQNNADVPAICTVRWGGIDIGNCGAKENGSCRVGTEWVWYDVDVKRADDNQSLASKDGVYGNSTVVLVKE